ncbi:hypothetical protein IFM61606_05917 [Aspergillus udagawae]|uniref:Uncharacterized protein n=1 Tax=Aspergillus udagawae TaxID=91492 RepID=A0ABQ1APE8_9EURO|nr:hypothetical protein IFM51744_06047 [Aspergillus udagawae]GFF85654.1 hypothetical protein IFM53868_04551 [Aspergillus udagawae]GFG06274.1 hypothetical protein IFM5058_02839 [Aspergillus udagawae]GFG25955.1 hypothetical protein IFM61606_05917 [Aspergillus udagawae]
MHSTSISEGTSAGQSPLQIHIEELSSLPLHDSIQTLAHLLPELTTSITATGERLVTHPTYEGIGKLDDLGILYLRAADRCTREHASFKTRLLHVSLDSMIEALYASSQKQLKKGMADGSVHLPPRLDEGCACCNGEPFAVILAGFHEGNALLFWEDEYKTFWGEEESRGKQYGLGERWIMASREQVERAMAREEASVIPSML